jgi:hypothetical protein
LEFNEVIVVEAMFCHSQFVWVFKLYVLVMLLYSGLNLSTNLSSVHLATLTRDALYPWSPQFQVVLHRMEEAGNLPRQQANTLDVFDQHSAKAAVFCLDIRQESD